MSNTPDNKRPRAGQTTLLNIEIIVDENVTCRVNHQQLRAGCLAAASHRNFDEGEIGIRVTTDQAIHQLNREFLGHDYPTDVISFPYSARERRIEGELVVSVDTATERANELGWPFENEILLYVVHGTLHLTGMDDLNTDDRQLMRSAERAVMLQLGVGDIDRYAADGLQMENHRNETDTPPQEAEGKTQQESAPHQDSHQKPEDRS